MARGNSFTANLSGSIGPLTFRVVGERQVVSRKIQHMRDPRTLPQIDQRIKFPNIVATYRAFRGLLREGFESRYREGRRLGGNDYNRFLSLNLQSAPVYLTRAESAAGYCVAAPYRVTDGSLPAVRTLGSGADTCSDIALGGLEITDATTVAEFAEAVVASNPLFDYGDAISYVSVLQEIRAATGVPFISVSLCKVSLDAADGSPLRSSAPARGFSARGGYLGNGPGVGQGAFAWIHSRRGAQGPLVSSQRLVVANPLFDLYGGDVAKRAARLSYGFEEVPLEPL